MKNFIQRVFFPSYKRTISVLVVLILVLSIPITLRLVDQQQDLRQRAASACDDNGNCFPVDCASNLSQGSCEAPTLSGGCFWYGGGPGENARCVDNNGQMSSTRMCNGGHCYTNQYYCTATDRCSAGDPCGSKLCDPINETCIKTGVNIDTTTCLTKSVGALTSYCGTPNGTPNNLACSSGYCNPSTLLCDTQGGGGGSSVAPAAPAAPASSATTISKFIACWPNPDPQNCYGYNGTSGNLTVPINSGVILSWYTNYTGADKPCSLSGAQSNQNFNPLIGTGSQLLIATTTSAYTVTCGTDTKTLTINVGGAAAPPPTTTTQTCSTATCPAPNTCVNNVCTAPAATCSAATCAAPSTCVNNVCTAPNTTGAATFAFTTSLPGIASGGLGRNANPKKNQRAFSIALFAPNTQTKGLDGMIGSIQQANLVFNGSNTYTGQIQLTGVTPGSYFVKIKTDNSNWKLVPGAQTLTQGSTTTVPQVALVTGDLNNNNGLDVGDYSSMISCIKNACDGNTKSLADLNDDSLVDEIDLNILYSGFPNRNGD